MQRVPVYPQDPGRLDLVAAGVFEDSLQERPLQGFYQMMIDLAFVFFNE